MPRRRSPEDLARLGRKRRYAPLVAELRKIAREPGLRPARTALEKGEPGSFWLLTQMASGLVRARDGHPVPESLKRIPGLAQAVLSENERTVAQGGEVPPVFDHVYGRETVGARGRPAKSGRRWRAILPEVLVAIWTGKESAPRLVGTVEEHDGPSLVYRGMSYEVLVERVRFALTSRGFASVRKDAIDDVVRRVYRARERLEESVESIGLSGLNRRDPSRARESLRIDAERLVTAPEHIREAAVARALLDLRIPLRGRGRGRFSQK